MVVQNFKYFSYAANREGGLSCQYLVFLFEVLSKFFSAALLFSLFFSIDGAFFESFYMQVYFVEINTESSALTVILLLQNRCLTSCGEEWDMLFQIMNRLKFLDITVSLLLHNTTRWGRCFRYAFHVSLIDTEF